MDGDLRALARSLVSTTTAPAGTDPAELLKALAAPIYFRLVLTEEPVDETTADRAVDVAPAAAHASALPAPCRTQPTAGPHFGL
ncbi:TetR/AcrR family transcriptional regulator C-terminal ligand-binding domain-containing protein [Streptomyces sp. NPDC059650]|uniref:TetR/AcrR family transcriptional regulator C-terminal ligand-binding domain-containing protein n=1 Tax=Streptomyces sp. NPDC059650 TaxID=3346896 RepID=UPI0036866005